MIEHRLTFDAACYTADAVERAAYRFSDRLSSEVSADAASITCVLRVSGGDAVQAEQVLADFRNEVLDQTLRARIRDETREVRNLILALAFSNTELVDGETS